MPEQNRLTAKVNINDMPKWFKAIYILAPIAGLLMIATRVDNDFYFIFKTGEYIINNGLPHTDFLSMHSDMHMIAQQWLSAVIFYSIYEVLGRFGVIAFVYICYTLLCIVMFKLTNLITNNLFIGCAFAFVADILAASMFEKTRPQAITMLLILTALYLLESYVQKKKLIYLALLPVISLLLINLHAAMWIMLFVFAAPYGAAAIPFKFKNIKQEPCCSFIKLIICGVVCVGVGFINPYGFEAMKYIVTSFGQGEINQLIQEMQKTSLADAWGIVFFSVLAILLCIGIFVKQKAFTTRFVLLFLGTTLMALFNSKSIAYFIIGGIPAFSYLVKDAQIKLRVDKGKRTKKEKKKLVLLVSLMVVMLGVLAVVVTSHVTNTAPIENKTNQYYESLDDIVEILDKENKDDVVLFAGFNVGQYFEYYGYHPYIDGRAELFLKENNKKFDYLNEYNEIVNAQIYYKDFINKYHFNYFVIDKHESYLETSLKKDKDYELVYKSDYLKLFRLKDTADAK